MSHGKIAFAHKLIYRALDSGYAAFVVSGDLLVRHVAEFVPSLSVAQVAVNKYCLRRDLVAVDHFKLPHRHHLPFFVH